MTLKKKKELKKKEKQDTQKVLRRQQTALLRGTLKCNALLNAGYEKMLNLGTF